MTKSFQAVEKVILCLLCVLTDANCCVHWFLWQNKFTKTNTTFNYSYGKSFDPDARNSKRHKIDSSLSGGVIKTRNRAYRALHMLYFMESFFFGDSSTINLKRKQICAPGTVVPRNFDKYLGQSTEIIYGLRAKMDFFTLCPREIELSDRHQ